MLGMREAVRYFLYFYNFSVTFKFRVGQSTPPSIIKHRLDLLLLVNHASCLTLQIT